MIEGQHCFHSLAIIQCSLVSHRTPLDSFSLSSPLIAPLRRSADSDAVEGLEVGTRITALSIHFSAPFALEAKFCISGMARGTLHVSEVCERGMFGLVESWNASSAAARASSMLRFSHTSQVHRLPRWEVPNHLVHFGQSHEACWRLTTIISEHKSSSCSSRPVPWSELRSYSTSDGRSGHQRIRGDGVGFP